MPRGGLHVAWQEPAGSLGVFCFLFSWFSRFSGGICPLLKVHWLLARVWCLGFTY